MRRVGAIVGCFAGGGELVHLIEAGEVVQRLGRGWGHFSIGQELHAKALGALLGAEPADH